MPADATITWLEDSKGRLCIAQNKFYGQGEPWGHKSAVGMGQTYFPKAACEDEEWWLRNCDLIKAKHWGGFHHYDPNPLQHKAFGRQALHPDHSRRVFAKLARQGHSFSEENYRTLQEEKGAQQHMSRRYRALMRGQSATSLARDGLPAGGAAARSASLPAAGPGRSQPKLAATWSSGDAAGEEAERSSAKPKAAKLSAKAARPKAELRAMANGKRIVVLPNSRLQVPAVPADVHKEFPPIFARSHRTMSLDHNGEMVFF